VNRHTVEPVCIWEGINKENTVKMWIGFIWLREWSISELFNKPSCCINCGYFIYRLRLRTFSPYNPYVNETVPIPAAS
jgi:hypothetical protein